MPGIDLDHLERLEREATTANWKYDGVYDVMSGTDIVATPGLACDGEFIAEVRNQLPAILARMRKLEKVAAAARSVASEPDVLDQLSCYTQGIKMLEALRDLNQTGEDQNGTDPASGS